MALRVLLADESSTIKKVIQLALQDFGVEVKSVPVGIDVLAVSKTFKPDLIFADVLLSKKSGYDVSRELKHDPEMKNVPVILMWSGFMELDEGKAKNSLADDRLEKPFDADILRNLIRKYVPRTNTSTISPFLNFPPMPEFEEPAPTASTNEMDEMPIEAIPELDEEFSQVPLHTPQEEPEAAEDGWSQQNISKFKLPEENTRSFNPEPTRQQDRNSANDNGSFDKFMIPENDLGEVKVESDGEFEEVTFSKKSPQAAPIVNQLTNAIHTAVASNISAAANKPLSATETVLLERVAREEARQVIEAICWKILPEITERVVREEINKILKQAEKEI